MHSGGKLVERYGDWLRAPVNREALEQRLKAMLPPDVSFTAGEALDESERALAALADVSMPLPDNASVLAAGVLAPLARFEEQFNELGKGMLEGKSTPTERRRLAQAQESLARLIAQFKRQRLIDFLSAQAGCPASPSRRMR